MTMFFLQTLFFVAVAFGLGCLCGCWLKGRFGKPHKHSGAAGAVTHEGAVRTSTAGELASSWPHYEPATTPQPIAALTPKPAAEAKPEPEASSEVSASPAPPAASAPPAQKAAKSKPTKAKPAKSKAGKPASGQPAANKSAAAPVAPMAASLKTAKPKPAKARPQAAAVADNLKQIKGVGPRIEAKLNAAGINSFAQIAAWTRKEQADFAEQLSFAGRIEREDWVGQARILAKGGSTDFAKRVVRGEVASSAGGTSKPGKAT
ncbi:hypothetical protein [Hoeflea sp.]|uniref:hypothetical protein n=1 Tax=Hoeflea sp. TaxID=1940281 RepID=UPI0019AC6031|nr:hypothetical protein [Hoeflea sp.]MBC7282704.1 hypothetical protein [Hoeflea sp.]